MQSAAEAHGAEYVDTGGNLGFAAGVNAGLRRVPADDDVLLLNPDAVVTGEAIADLQTFVHAPGNERLAAVSPALVHADGSSQRVRWPLPTPGRMWREAVGLSRLLPPPDEYCVGAVLLLRAEAIADVGFFDERFFLYAEEADWQKRALDRGWRTTELPSANALHIGAGTSADSDRREALFHAGQETYIRKWHGRHGWLAYRAAAGLGAAARAAMLPAAARARALARARLYMRSPRRVAQLGPRDSSVGRRIAHVVVTDSFAGVERYVCELAREQAARGSIVSVIGGNAARMTAELGSARHLPAADVKHAVLQLALLGRQDIVHAHMTAAEFAAVTAKPLHQGRIISTRHFARSRGSTPVARVGGRAMSAAIHRQIAISEFVAQSIGEPAVVVPNGVRRQPDESRVRSNVVLCMNRLEPEKATDVALRAWAASGLPEQGWELHLAGSGSLRAELENLAHTLGVSSSVRWLGHVANTRQHLHQASLLLAAATAEPFGLSIAEAMACGTPVLASDGGAHPELLGADGFLFPTGNAAAAAAALQRVAKMSSDERAQRGRRLRERQRRLFDLSRHVSIIDEHYAAVLEPANEPRHSSEHRDLGPALR